MIQKIKILEILNSVKDGSGKIPVNNLETLVNFNNNLNVVGGEFLQLMLEMKTEELITSNESEWNYSITENGIEYLKKNKT